MVRRAFGEDAVVLSTKPCAEGVEVLAMAPESIQQIERVSAAAARSVPNKPVATPVVLEEEVPAAELVKPRLRVSLNPFAHKAPDTSASTPTSVVNPERSLKSRLEKRERLERTEPGFGMQEEVARDVQTLSMSTLSFQDYVRERMLKRRQAELDAQEKKVPAARSAADLRLDKLTLERVMRAAEVNANDATEKPLNLSGSQTTNATASQSPVRARRAPPVLRDELPAPMFAPTPNAAPVARQRASVPTLSDAHLPQTQREQQEMMTELRSVKGMIEERFGALAFIEKMQRQPCQARMSQKLLECGFSPALIRKLVDAMPADVHAEFARSTSDAAAADAAWASQVLERNLLTDEGQAPLEDVPGAYALIGSTGVGKTTTTAKMAAAFATRHGASNLGLITLDAYRVGAHEQLRAYGRILGVPVHTAHDRSSLEDLLELLSCKKMILIDTAGIAQRDARTRDMLEMLSARAIKKLLVINASAQGETIEDIVVAWRAQSCTGVVLSKIDETVKLAPALDTLIRHKLRVLGVANGQRVPEDWHRLSAHALVQRALRSGSSSAWRMDASDVNLVFTAVSTMAAPARANASVRPAV